MRIHLILSVLVLIICAHETVQSNRINDIYIEYDDLLGLNKVSEAYTNLRNLNDVSSKIKKGILIAWEVFKVVAKNTKTKVNTWIEQEKEKLNKLSKIVEERLDKVKNDFENEITKIITTGDNVKECIAENKNLENIFNSIISKLKICLSNIVENVSNLEMTDDFHDLDDSTFLNYVQNELSTVCEENNEKCLDDVQYEIIVEIIEAAQDITNQHFEIRNAIDDHLESAILCITESLTMAAETIAEESVKIVECVKNKANEKLIKL